MNFDTIMEDLEAGRMSPCQAEPYLIHIFAEANEAAYLRGFQDGKDEVIEDNTRLHERRLSSWKTRPTPASTVCYNRRKVRIARINARHGDKHTG